MASRDRHKENVAHLVHVHDSARHTGASSRLRRKETSVTQDRRPRQTKLTTVNNPTHPPLVDKGLAGGAQRQSQRFLSHSLLEADCIQCGPSEGMVSARLSPGASIMDSDSRKPVRGQNANGPPSRTKQGPYITPRLATNTRDTRKEERVVSPRIERIEEEVVSPNVTPRSAARQARGPTSAQSTPEVTPLTTPASSRPASMVSPSLHNQNLRTEMQFRPSFVRSPSDRSQFFFASDAQNRRSRSPGSQPKTKSFVYANGQEEELLADMKREGRRTSRSSGRLPPADTSFQKRRMASRSPSATSQVRPKTSSAAVGYMRISQSQVHLPVAARHVEARSAGTQAGIVPEQQGQSNVMRVSPGSSNVSQLAASPDFRILSRTIRGAAPRSKSPLKKFDVGTLTSPPQRKDSVGETTTQQRLEHSKLSSPSSIEDDRVEEVVQSAPLLPGPASPALPLSPTRPSVTPNVPLYSVPGSPTKRDSGELTATVADARRERKVLDLEISNNSLLAFNRSLEKEVRKLKSELRRHRRMTGVSAFSEMPLPRRDDAEHEPQEELDSGSDPSDSASTLSGDDASEQRVRDERRLQKEFTKHQQLLHDSRDMNSSIMRCLDVTCALIADGKKALATEAATEEGVGGRVLDAEDVAGGLDSGRGLLRPVADGISHWNGQDDVESGL